MRAQTRAGRPRGAAPADRGTLQASDNTAQPGATAHPIRRQLFLGRAVSRRAPFAVRIGVGSIVLELQKQHNVVDFAALDRIVSRRHRVIVHSHIATDEVILTALDRGAVTYLTKSESKDHLIDAIRAAGTDTPYVGPRMALAMLNDSTIGRANLAPRKIEVLIAVSHRKQGSRRPPTADRTDDRSHPPAAGAREVRHGGTAGHHQGRVGGQGDSGRHRQCPRHLANAWSQTEY